MHEGVPTGSSLSTASAGAATISRPRASPSNPSQLSKNVHPALLSVMNSLPEVHPHPLIAVVVGALCAIGIAANAMMAFVRKPKLPETVNCFVLQLLLTDLIVLLTYGAVAVPTLYNGSVLFQQKPVCMIQQAFAFQTCVMTVVLSVRLCVAVTNADCCVGRTMSSVLGAYSTIALCWLYSAVVLLLTWLSGCGAAFSAERPFFSIQCSKGKVTDEPVFLLYLYGQLIAPALLLLIHAGVVVSSKVKRTVATAITADALETSRSSPDLIIRSFAVLALSFVTTIIYWSLLDNDSMHISLFITFTGILNSSIKPFIIYSGKLSKQAEHSLLATIA